MSARFDPYVQWLGIRDSERPPNHYRLLGIDLFESDPDVIDSAADRQMTHVRTFQNGPHWELTQKLLNELAAARVVLLDPAKKAAYDDALRKRWLPLRPEIRLDTGESTLRLGRPGRGRRTSVRGKLVAAVLSLLALAGIAYAVYVRLGPSMRSDLTAEATNATEQPAATEGELDRSTTASHQTDSSDPAGLSNQRGADAPNTPAPPVDASHRPTPRSSLPAPRSDGAGRGSSAGRGSPDPADVGPDEWLDPSRAAVPWSEKPAWNAYLTERRFSVTDPVESILLHLSVRDIDHAREAHTLSRSSPQLAHGREVLDRMELLIDQIDYFWQAADEAARQLEAGQQLAYRTALVTVASRTLRSVWLRTAAGIEREFSLDRRTMDPHLAVALVRSLQPQGNSAADLWIGTFLAIDRHGDLELAREYLDKAQLYGDPARAVAQTIDYFMSQPLRDAAPEHSQPAESAPVSDRPGLLRIPSREVQQKLTKALVQQYARQLASRDHQQRCQLAQTLIDSAISAVPGSNSAVRGSLGAVRGSLGAVHGPNSAVRGSPAPAPTLDPSTRYVTLDYARRLANSAGELTIALAAIQHLEQLYGVDGWTLRKQAVQSAARRVMTSDQQVQLADRVTALADQAAMADQYELADWFVSSAIDMADRLNDPVRGQTLVTRKQQLRELRALFDRAAVAQQQLATAPDDPDANQLVGLYIAFGKEKFLAAADYLAKSEDPLLRMAASYESRGAGIEADDKKKLADTWLERSDAEHTFLGDAMRQRAAYWYRQALPQLGPAAADDARKQIARIESQRRSG